MSLEQSRAEQAREVWLAPWRLMREPKRIRRGCCVCVFAGGTEMTC